MGPTVPAVGSLDTDIEKMRTEGINIVKALQAKRSALLTSILCDRDATGQLRNSATESQGHQLDILIGYESYQNDLQANRLCAGATLFNPHQTGPFAEALKRNSVLQQDALLGVRIERFDQQKRTYSEPAYLLLKSGSTAVEQGDEAATEDTAGESLLIKPLTVVNHTLPTSVSISEIERQYLRQGSNAEDSASMRLQDFVQECQRALSTNDNRC